MWFPGKGYWGVLSVLSSGDLPNPGLEHTSPVSPALVGRFFIMDPPEHIYNGRLPSHLKKWNSAICNNMDGLGGYYAKWNKSVNSLSSIIEKDIILYNITYMLNQKKKKTPQTSKYNKKEADLQIERTSSYQWWEGSRGSDRGLRGTTNKYKISYKGILYHTGNIASIS